MKKTNRYISLLLALVFAAGLSSCIKEDYADSTKNDKATVSLVFDTRAPGVDGQTVQAGSNEGIKTLRVIIVDSESSTVNVNKLYDYSAEAGPVEVKTLTIMNLPVGQKDFYVIANEGSVEMNGINLDTWQEKGTFNESDKNELLQAVIASGFPKTDAEIAELGLPIAGWQSENISTEDQVIEIPITRAVAKMELTLTNNTGALFQLDQVAMGSFFPNKTYLFPGKTLSEGVTYAAHTFETNATLEEGATETFCFYFYESNAGENAYTIQLNDGSEYGATPILVEPEVEGGQATPLTSVERNTCVRVKGTIESKAWTLLANVLPWQHEEVSFDFDDTMSYTSEGWKEGTYRSKEGNNIRLFNDRMAAELNFTITAPSSLVRWTAELLEEGDGHYFEFDGPSSGEVFIGDATSAPMQTIKVRVINPDDEDYHEATLRVVATLLNGESYELDLTGEGGTAPGIAETINRYTLIQAR